MKDGKPLAAATLGAVLIGLVVLWEAVGLYDILNTMRLVGGFAGLLGSGLVVWGVVWIFSRDR